MLFKKLRSINVDEEPKTLWNPSFITILVIGFLTGSANQMVNPQLAEYAVSLGASLALAGTIVGLRTGVAMFLRPFSGAANDVLNRKHVMVGSILIAALSLLGYMLFKNITAMILCRLLQGFSVAFMGVARTAFATEYIPENRMGEGVAFTSFGLVLSQAIGPGIGLWMSEHWGYGVCFFTAFLLCLSGATLIAMLPYKYTKGEFHWNKLKLKNLIAVEIIPYAILTGMFTLSTQLANSFLVLMGDERGIGGVAIFFTIYALVAMVVRPLSGRILDRFGLPILLYPSFVFAFLTLVLLGTAQTITLIIIAGLCRALSQGIAMPSIQGMAIKRLGRERAGVTAATIYMGMDLLNTAGPAIGGVLATHIGYANMFYSFAAFVTLGIPIYMLLRHFEKKRGIDCGDQKAETAA